MSQQVRHLNIKKIINLLFQQVQQHIRSGGNQLTLVIDPNRRMPNTAVDSSMANYARFEASRIASAHNQQHSVADLYGTIKSQRERETYGRINLVNSV